MSTTSRSAADIYVEETIHKFDLNSLPPFVDAGEGRLMMAMKFFELGRLSLGQAAELAGYTKRAFIDVLGHYGIPVADYAASELAAEVVW